MLVNGEVLLEALKAAQHEPPKPASVAEEPRAGTVAASRAETPRAANEAAPAAGLKVLSQGELEI